MGNGLTSAESILRRLKEGYDPDYHNTLYRQVMYSLGEKWAGVRGLDTDSGRFPHYPSIKVKYLQIGQSRRILNSQFIGLSKVMYSEPEPEFPQVDKWTAEVRKQFFLERYRGTGYADGSWQDQDCPMFMDGEGTGVGFKQWGLTRDPATGFMYVDSEHVPCYNVIWDRFARVPSRSRYVCFVNYLSVEEAKRVYGKKAEDYISKNWDADASKAIDQVRVFEYFDIGSSDGKERPTKAVMLGEMDSDPVLVEANEWGCLPESHYVHFIAPGMDRPIGRIGLQMSTQEALNDLERYVRRLLKQPGFRMIDMSQIHPEDARRIVSGNFPENVRFTPPNTPSPAPPAMMVGGAEAGAWLQFAWSVLERQYSTDSGQSDFERGNLSSDQRTLGENQLLDARSQVQGAWSELQAQKMHVRNVERALHIAGIGDRLPTVLDVFGFNVPVNESGVPQSYISAFLEERSRVVIDVQKLSQGDVERERAQRVANLQMLREFVGVGIDPNWYLQEILKAAGEADPKEAMGGAAQQAAPSVNEAGMPMAGDPAAAMGGGAGMSDMNQAVAMGGVPA